MCSVNCKDDDTPDDPADTITPGHAYEHNENHLGESKLISSKLVNFVTSSNFISMQEMKQELEQIFTLNNN